MYNRKNKLNTFICLSIIFSTSLISGFSAVLFISSYVSAQTTTNYKIEADRLLDQGIKQFQNSQFEAALQSWQLALNIYREIRDRRGEGNVLLGLGMVNGSLGDYPKAINYFQETLKIAQEIKDRRGEGKSLGNLGIASRILGDYPKAINYHLQSLKIFQEMKDRREEGIVLGNLGLAYNNLGDYPKAIEYLQERLKIAQEIKDRRGESAALGNFGLVYENLGNYHKAIQYHLQALKIDQEIEDRAGEGNTLGNIGVAYYKLGDYPKSIEYHLQHLKIAQDIQDRKGEGNALNNLGVTYYKQGNINLAESTLIESMNIKESLRVGLKDNDKVSFFDTQLSTYRILQKVLIAQNKTEVALEISERSRGRAFVDLLASKLSSNLKEQLSTPPKIDQIKKIAKTQNSTLLQYSVIYDRFKVADKFQVKESELYIWVIKPTGNITFRKVDLKPLWQKDNTDLDELVITVRNNIGARGTSFRGIKVSYNPDNVKTRSNLRRLHELLINPIADLLPKNENERVIFIPQSGLFLVPFPALQDANGKYLIEKHTILTSPFIQVLDLTRKRKESLGTQPIQGKNTLIVGNPTMPLVSPKIGETPQQLVPLPGAEREAKAIGSLLNTQPLIADQATKASVLERLPQARFVHLATHGLFDDVQGINSSIALAPDRNLSKQGEKNGDGLLTAGEILDLKLNAELVVLSACNTGRGRITGDGVTGLSRSLISAGVPSVLVSLWSVPDAPTALLMTQFYQNLQKNPDKAQALRQAMLATMKNNPNPFDWAAFTLIGEAQ